MSYNFVIGGAGYIGSQVVNNLIDKKKKVIIIDNLSTGKRILLNKEAKFYKIDLKDRKKLFKIFNKYKKKIDTVFHFAASLSVPESQNKPGKYYVNNVLGTENLLQACEKNKIKYFIFSSTCAVYGNETNSRKVSEKNLTLPSSNYGKTKLLSEKLVINYSKRFKMNYSILRYFNVMGADKKLRSGQLYSGSLFKEISKKIIKKKYEIDLFGNDYNTKDKTCVRDYIDVNDLADLHLEAQKKIKQNKSSYIINCGYGKGISVKEIISTFSKVINKEIKINTKPRRPGDVESVYCNNSYLKKVFPNWKQKMKLIQSIQSAINWETKINKLNI